MQEPHFPANVTQNGENSCRSGIYLHQILKDFLCQAKLPVAFELDRLIETFSKISIHSIFPKARFPAKNYKSSPTLGSFSISLRSFLTFCSLFAVLLIPDGFFF